ARARPRGRSRGSGRSTGHPFPRGVRVIRPTRVTRAAAVVSVIVMLLTLNFLVVRYPSLPWLLPVHFKPSGAPNGWQYKTYWRVLLPVFVQIALAATLGAVSALLLSRPRAHQPRQTDEPDVRAAAAAAEAVALITAVW